MSTKINVHANNDKDRVSLETNTYDHTNGSAIRFHTIELSYAGINIVLFVNDDEALIDSLNKVIDGAQAKLDAMLSVGV